MSRRVLLTGGAGYIGSHTAFVLLEAGHEVVVLDDLSNARASAVARDAIFIEGSVGDRALTERIIRDHGIASVVHLAGSIGVEGSFRDPISYYQNNTLATHSLLGACLGGGVEHFVFSSSAAVYGIPASSPVGETAPTNPINPYGTSKLMAEHMVRDCAAGAALRFVSLRYFNVAGNDTHGRGSHTGRGAKHLVKLAAEAAVGKREKLTIFGDDYETPDGTCIRDYIHVGDIANAHLSALRYLEQGRGSVTLNCGCGRGHSVREVLDAVERAIAGPLPVVSGPRRPGDPPALVASTDLIRQTLDWSPAQGSIEAIVESAISWENDN